MTEHATRNPLYLCGMGGLGDALYLRPFVRAVAEARGEVWLRTPWPQLYRDLPAVRPVRWDGIALRAPARNQDAQDPAVWHRPPADATAVPLRYDLARPGESIPEELARRAAPYTDGRPVRFDLPDAGPCPIEADGRPLAVVRPVTLRREWRNPARAPWGVYVAEAAIMLRTAGYRVVSVADVDGREEWIAGYAPPADVALHGGELDAEQLLALVRDAALVVGGPGWIVPAAVSAGTPLVVIGGGQGGHNAPERLVGPPMDGSRTRSVLPDDYCRCTDRGHDCPKGIADFDARFPAAVWGAVHARTRAVLGEVAGMVRAAEVPA